MASFFCKDGSRYCPRSGLGRFLDVWPSSFVVSMTVSEECGSSVFSYSKPEMKGACSWCLSAKLNGVTYQQTVNLIVTCRVADPEVQGDALVQYSLILMMQQIKR